MPFELQEVLRARRGENFRLQARYMNPQMGRVLKTIGFDHYYERGEGCYLYDADGGATSTSCRASACSRSAAPTRRQPGPARGHRRRPAQSGADGLRAVAGAAGRGAGRRGARRHRACLLHNSGAEAIESAIKFARMHTNGDRIVYCDHGFHGLTTGALSLNGGNEFSDGFGPLLPGRRGALRRHRRAGPRAAPTATSPPSWSSRSRARASTSPPRSTGAPSQELCRRHKTLLRDGRGPSRARAHRQVLLPRALGPATRHRHRVQGAVGRLHPRRGDVVARPRSSTACSARWTGPWSTPPRSRRTSSPWWRGWRRCRHSTTRTSSTAPGGPAMRSRRRLEPLVERYELLAEVRGKGLMIGLVFGKPESRGAAARWTALEAMPARRCSPSSS